MQLNQSRAELASRGVGIAAITPDPVAVLAAFGRHHHIEYPLLSDHSGEVISRYGLRNPNIPQDHPRQSRWLPFPGIMLIDGHRVVRAKFFTGDLRRRAAAQNVLLDLGDERTPDASASGERVRATVHVATTRVFPGQDVAVRLRLAVDDGWHVYAPSVDAPYTGLRITVAPSPRFTVADVRAPEAEVLELAGLGESLPVLAGVFDVDATLQVQWSPPPSMFAEIAPAVARRHLEPGPHEVELEIAYQACSDTECEPPARLRIPLVLEVQPRASAADGLS